MTTEQMRADACSILGVGLNATREEIIAAWKQKMQRVHPDVGGSDFFAKQVNWACDTLLGKRTGSRPGAEFRTAKADGGYRRPPDQPQDETMSFGKGLEMDVPKMASMPISASITHIEMK